MENHDEIIINNINVKFLSNKHSEYTDNLYYYFVFLDEDINDKLKILIDSEYYRPFFKNDKNKYIVKVKDRYMNDKEKIKKEDKLVVDISFKKYNFIDKIGYYVNELKIQK